MSRRPRRDRPSPAAVLALAALALPAWAALGPRYGGDLSAGAVVLPAGTDPDRPLGAGEALVGGLVHETLVRLEAGGELSPGLARDWLTCAEGREWILRLAPAAAFHDGSPLTADDAVRSLRRFLRGGSPAALRLAETLEGGAAFRAGRTDDLPGLQAGAGELQLRFTRAVAAPLAPLAAVASAVTAPRGAAAGPFIPTANVPGRRLALTAFSAHVRGRPFLDRVQLVAVADPAALEVELQARRLALAVGVGHGGPPAATLLLALDPARSPFDRPAVRAGVADALARSDFLRQIVPAAETMPALLPSRLLAPRPASSSPPRRVAGPAGVPVTLAVSTEVAPLLSQRLIAHLAELGLRVTAVPSPPSSVLQAPADARLILWFPEVAEPELALRALARLGPSLPAVEAALAEATRDLDPERRRGTLQSAEAALRAAAVLVPLGVLPAPFRARGDLHGLAVDAAGRLVLEDAWLER